MELEIYWAAVLHSVRGGPHKIGLGPQILIRILMPLNISNEHGRNSKCAPTTPTLPNLSSPFKVFFFNYSNQH